MTIMAIDPASHVCGVALMRDGELVDAFILRARASATLIERTVELVADLERWRSTYCPDVIAIEVPSGKIAARQGGGAWRGLTSLGFAVGAIWQAMRRDAVRDWFVRAVSEREWTGGKPKATRARILAAAYPAYQPAKDRGMDAADAIGIAIFVWGEERRQKKGSAK